MASNKNKAKRRREKHIEAIARSVDLEQRSVLSTIPPRVEQGLVQAAKSGHYMIAVFWVDPDNDTLLNLNHTTVEFPTAHFETAQRMLKTQIGQLMPAIDKIDPKDRPIVAGAGGVPLGSPMPPPPMMRRNDLEEAAEKLASGDAIEIPQDDKKPEKVPVFGGEVIK